MEQKKLKELAKGEFFTRKPIENPTEKQVFVKGDYERSTKKYSVLRFDDMNEEWFLKGDTVVFVGFTF